jgi:hypothetical protein
LLQPAPAKSANAAAIAARNLTLLFIDYDSPLLPIRARLFALAEKHKAELPAESFQPPAIVP